MKDKTIQTRHNVITEYDLLLDLEKEKLEKTLKKRVRILEYFLEDSPKFMEALGKLKSFKDNY